MSRRRWELEIGAEQRRSRSAAEVPRDCRQGRIRHRKEKRFSAIRGVPKELARRPQIENLQRLPLHNKLDKTNIADGRTESPGAPQPGPRTPVRQSRGDPRVIVTTRGVPAEAAAGTMPLRSSGGASRPTRSRARGPERRRGTRGRNSPSSCRSHRRRGHGEPEQGGVGAPLPGAPGRRMAPTRGGLKGFGSRSSGRGAEVACRDCRAAARPTPVWTGREEGPTPKAFRPGQGSAAAPRKRVERRPRASPAGTAASARGRESRTALERLRGEADAAGDT